MNKIIYRDRRDRSLTTIDHWTLPRDLIDQLSLSYQGNQRTTTTDSKTNLAYSGSSEFVKRLAGRYSYNVNGALSKDENRGIDTITYDLCGNPNKIIFADGSEIEYEYTAEGKKLQTKHKRGRRSGNLIFYEMPEVTTYVGNLVMKDSHPEMLQFDGGYASFDHDTIAGLHLYIRDYMGNNRMVVNRDGTIEQITHYYPYGGVIGDISTNENLQKFKFEGKELDRTFGLDNYDIHARNYFAMAPMCDRIDPMAEKYYGISPYAYCGGDPVNCVDKNGKEVRPEGYVEYAMILRTLSSQERFYVAMNNQGYIDKDILALCNSESINISSLTTLVESKTEIQVSLNDNYDYMNNEGNISNHYFENITCDESLKDEKCEFTQGLSTGEMSDLGKTLLPGPGSSEQSSLFPNVIRICVNPQLSKMGQAETYSHEANGHAVMFLLTGDRIKSGHIPVNGVEQNTELKSRILKSRLETINNN